MLIPRWVLKVAGVASDDDARPGLNVVQIERDAKNRPAMYATDGIRALGVMWNELSPDRWLAPVICEAKRVAGSGRKARNMTTPMQNLNVFGFPRIA